MCRPAAALAALLLLFGCDAREPLGPRPDPAPRLVANVKYEVTGTYAACKITYADPKAGKIELDNAPLPWSRSVRVTVDEETGPFDAFVLATCTDPAKRGKSTALLLIDGEIKRRGTGEGPGATSEASFRIGEDE